jgi:hypothetical protein
MGGKYKHDLQVLLSPRQTVSVIGIVEDSSSRLNEKFPSVIRSWPEKQDAYTPHRPVRPVRNPFSVNYLLDVWECDLLDIQAFGKFKDN